MNIGIAHIEYNEQGVAILGTFTADTLSLDSDTIAQLSHLECNEDTILKQSEQLLAKFFQSVNDVELADREEYKIVTEFLHPCEKWPDGKMKSCDLKFSMEKI